MTRGHGSTIVARYPSGPTPQHPQIVRRKFHSLASRYKMAQKDSNVLPPLCRMTDGGTYVESAAHTVPNRSLRATAEINHMQAAKSFTLTKTLYCTALQLPLHRKRRVLNSLTYGVRQQAQGHLSPTCETALSYFHACGPPSHGTSSHAAKSMIVLSYFVMI